VTNPDPADPDDALFAALADRTRRAILRQLVVGPMSVHDVAAHFDVSRPAISKHLDVLRAAGLLSVTPQGRERIHNLSSAAAAGRLAAWRELLVADAVAAAPAASTPRRRPGPAPGGPDFEVWRRRA
jgi:DNA-binding transcriptional ArsR family regulator